MCLSEHPHEFGHGSLRRHVIGLENTALKAAQSCFIDGEITDTYSTLVDAGITISERITKLTGIRNRDITGGIKIEMAIYELVEFCGDSILLGHNILFDYSFSSAYTVYN